MSLDKLVDSTQLDTDLASVANAIRAKSGGSGQLAFPAGFVSEIQAIPSGGGVPSYMRIAEVTVATQTNSLSIPCDHNVNACYAISSEFVSKTVLTYQYILHQIVVPNLKPYAKSIMTLKADGNVDYWQNGSLSWSNNIATVGVSGSYYYAAGTKYLFILFNTTEVQ